MGPALLWLPHSAPDEPFDVSLIERTTQDITMPPYRHWEETLNTQLAILLSRFGVQADAETIQVKGRKRPDVLIAILNESWNQRRKPPRRFAPPLLGQGGEFP